MRNIARGQSKDRACEVFALSKGNIFSKAREKPVIIVFVNRCLKLPFIFTLFRQKTVKNISILPISNVNFRKIKLRNEANAH